MCFNKIKYLFDNTIKSIKYIVKKLHNIIFVKKIDKQQIIINEIHVLMLKKNLKMKIS